MTGAGVVTMVLRTALSPVVAVDEEFGVGVAEIVAGGDVA